MKTVTVSGFWQVRQVRVNGREDDALTPKVARDAVAIAFGYGSYATVTDGKTSYRVTSRVRKIKQDR